VRIAEPLNGRDLRREPIEIRKAGLARLLRNAEPGLQLSEQIEHEAAIAFEHACKLGPKGIVSKRRGSRYQSGRSWVVAVAQKQESRGARGATAGGTVVVVMSKYPPAPCECHVSAAEFGNPCRPRLVAKPARLRDAEFRQRRAP